MDKLGKPFYLLFWLTRFYLNSFLIFISILSGIVRRLQSGEATQSNCSIGFVSGGAMVARAGAYVTLISHHGLAAAEGDWSPGELPPRRISNTT
jgi:hypothetical protein